MKNIDKYLSLLGQDVDALLLTSRYSRHYGAEFDIAEGVAIVTMAGCRYFTDSRYIESAQNGITGFEVLEINRENTYIKRINDAIADFGVSKLGFEENYLTVAEYNYYCDKIHGELIPYTGKINGFRGVKEEWELALMRKAQEITDKAFSDVLPRIKAGMTELELQAELIYCLYKNGGHGLSFDPIVVSGPNTSLPHGVAGDRVIREGDFITMDFGVLYNGYCSDMTRTVALGYATDEMKKVYDTVLRAQLAGIEAMAEGVPGSQVDKAARDIIEAAGYGPYFGHGLGHSLGLNIHESPRAAKTYHRELVQGNIITIEPGIYLPGKFGVRIEDMVYLAADGKRNLTLAPKELRIL